MVSKHPPPGRDQAPPAAMRLLTRELGRLRSLLHLKIDILIARVPRLGHKSPPAYDSNYLCPSARKQKPALFRRSAGSKPHYRAASSAAARAVVIPGRLDNRFCHPPAFLDPSVAGPYYGNAHGLRLEIVNPRASGILPPAVALGAQSTAAWRTSPRISARTLPPETNRQVLLCCGST